VKLIRIGNIILDVVMSEFDVLIVGGYALTERAGAETRDKIRLKYNNHFVTQDFIKYLVRNNGNLERTENDFIENNKSRLVSRSLNAIYILDYLNKNNVKSEVVNYFLLEQKRFKELMECKPKVLVISSTFISDISDMNQIASLAKDISPDTKIIAGGIKILKSHKKLMLFKEGYFDDYPEENIINNNFFFKYEQDKFIDIYVIEECGELTLLNLIKKIINKEDYRTTPNIAYYKKCNLIFTNQSKEPYTFENNLIAWDKIPENIIGQEIPVRAGIGCPFKCAFCDFTGLHKVKIRTIDNLIEELKLIQKAFPGRPIFFTDDNLFTSKIRTKQLAEAIIKNDLKFKWRGFFRVDAISEDNVEALAKSGCVNCLLGVESGDEQILEYMKKKASRNQTIKAVKLLNDHAINTLSTIIIGFPGETEASVDNTIELLNSYPNEKYLINNYYPFVFEISPLAGISSPDSRKRFKIVGAGENWQHVTMTSEQAKSELIRAFKCINKATLQYPEFYDPEIPFNKLKDVFITRDSIVKDSIASLDQNNVLSIYNRFNTILK
jgi:p-methyltransferase